MWHWSARRLPRAAIGLVACLTAVVATAPPAAAELAAITVTVTGADTFQPLTAGVCVYAYGLDGPEAARDCADSPTGEHTLGGLQAGSEYEVKITAGSPYPAETWLPGGPTITSAQPIAAPASMSAALLLAGTLSGTVFWPDQQPAAGISVSVFDSSQQQQCCGQATTAADGSWTIGGLYPWQYKVKYDGCCPEIWAVGKSDWSGADTISVAAGETTGTAEWLPAAALSGTITDAWTGAPVEGVCISPWSVDPTGGGSWSGGCSDQSGRYRAYYSTPGDYQIQFVDDQGRYASEFYDNALDRASAKIVTLPGVGEVTGIDAALTPAAVITGRAVDATTRKPVAWVCPYAYAGRSGPQLETQRQECSQEDGVWRVSGLPAGATTVFLRPVLLDYLDTWAYSSATQAKATVFDLQAGTTTRLRDVKLTRSGTLTGVVTDARTGAPVAGAWVTTDPFNPRDDPFYLIHVAQTDATGHYTIKGLAGDYTPLAFDQQGVYGFEWSGNADSQATAAPITLRAGRTTTYNVALDPAAVLTGQVIGGSGTVSTTAALVDVFTPTGDPVGWTSDVRSDGTFAVTGLPGGDIAVRLAYPNLDGTVVWHDGVPTRAAATLVPTSSRATSAIVTHDPWD
jgi:hypothetical protein